MSFQSGDRDPESVYSRGYGEHEGSPRSSFSNVREDSRSGVNQRIAETVPDWDRSYTQDQERRSRSGSDLARRIPSTDETQDWKSGSIQDRRGSHSGSNLDKGSKSGSIQDRRRSQSGSNLETGSKTGSIQERGSKSGSVLDGRRSGEQLLMIEEVSVKELDPTADIPVVIKDNMKYMSRAQIRAARYLQKKNIFEFFNYLLGHLLSATPKDPIPFLVNVLDQCLAYRDRTAEEEVEPPLLFTPKHVEILYKAFDPLGFGKLTMDQYMTAMMTMGIKSYNQDLPQVQPGFISEEDFSAEVDRCLTQLLDEMLRVHRPESMPQLPEVTLPEEEDATADGDVTIDPNAEVAIDPDAAVVIDPNADIDPNAEFAVDPYADVAVDYGANADAADTPPPDATPEDAPPTGDVYAVATPPRGSVDVETPQTETNEDAVPPT